LTYAHDDLQTLFNNQVATLGEWRDAEEEEEKDEGMVRPPPLVYVTHLRLNFIRDSCTCQGGDPCRPEHAQRPCQYYKHHSRA
jgi:hypothetical protein